MKPIGMIGGLSWHSTLDYYRHINEMVNFRLRGLHSAEIILHSVDFSKYASLSADNEWDRMLGDFTTIAAKLEQAGAQCLLLCANTVHKIADPLQQAIQLPLINIADAVADKLQESGIQSTALIGTRHTMEGEHYLQRLRDKGIRIYIPGDEEMQILHDKIYSELADGIFRRDFREWLVELIRKMQYKGAESVTLACTELPILLRGAELDLPVLDTTLVHAEAAVEFALGR